MNWREDATCSDLPQVLFYPPLFKEDRKGPEHKYYSLGKLACEVCPVRAKCSKDGKDEEFGLWGGLTPKERWGRPVRTSPKVLPPNLVRMLRSMGDDPDVIALHERIKPFMEKRS